MRKYYIYIVLAITFTACVKDLDVTPTDPNLVFPEEVYKNEQGYKQVLGKIYAGYHVAGQEGDSNSSDVTTISDGGMSAYLRNYWNFQELPTGEAINAWGDGGLVAIQNGTWSADNRFVAGMYYRLYYMIALTNEFLRQTTSDKLADRGHSALADQIKQMRAEARLNRAIAYYHGIDLFGSMSLIDENSTEKYPKTVPSKELYSWIVEELESLLTDLPEANAAEYGRMDKGTAYMVLAKMFLNAQNFAGEQNPIAGRNSYDEVVKYTEMVNTAYAFEEQYHALFYADNNQAKGIIFGVPIDPVNTQGWSATQYLVSGSTNGDFQTLVNCSEAWGGNRATRAVYDRFEAGDMRGTSATAESGAGLDHSVMLVINKGLDIEDPNNYGEGVNVFKFKNLLSDGTTPPVAQNRFVDIDFPMFRLADSYLMYAEAVLRGGNGDASKALGYVNAIRERAYGSTAGNIAANELTLDFLLEERGRELYYEGYRRQDLIRFGKFTSGSYLWPWKGGVQAGKALDDFRVIYPIPTSELAANPNAVQINSNY